MTLVGRAGRAQRMIALFDPDAGRRAADLVASLQSRDDPGRMRPIHGDMKPEHAFLSGCKTTLIDMEDLSLGDPDHDLATLEARLILAQVTGQAATADTEAARRQIRSLAGPAYLWFLACARLQCARFFAQRLDPATIPILRQVLADC
jgi:aminoglycoside phosphotransferase (APT) family kinase protein